MTVDYYTRAQWGADTSLPRLKYVVPPNQFKGLVVHHDVMVLGDWDSDGHLYGDTDDIFAKMRRLQTIRPDLGLDVPYSFVTFRGGDDADGIVCEGRGRAYTGAHTAGYNSSRWGVAISGNTSTLAITDGVVAAIRSVGAKLTADDVVATTGHRDHKATNCPGDSAYARLGEMQPPFRPALPGGDDMQIQLVNDTEKSRMFAVWRSRIRGKLLVDEYGSYRGPDAGTAMPGISYVIDEAIINGSMKKVG